MVGLLDIGDLTETVEVRGKKVEVRGMSARTFFHLLNTLPELKAMLTGMKIEEEITATLLMARVPEAVHSIIAAATTPGFLEMDWDTRQPYVNAAANMNMGEQAEFIRKIWDLTFPKGVRSFLDALDEVMKLAGTAVNPAQQSPEPSQSSETTVGQPMFGTSRPDK